MLDLLTVWTIRGSLFLLAAVLLGRLAGARWARSRLARWMWTAGLGAAMAHVLLAFHVYHDWSHRDALLETARKVEARVGWRFGAGIYFNYAFLAVWFWDAAWWWWNPSTFDRRRWWSSALSNGFLLLMAWSATVVFEEGAVRIAGCLVTAGMLITLVATGTGSRAKRANV